MTNFEFLKILDVDGMAYMLSEYPCSRCDCFEQYCRNGPDYSKCYDAMKRWLERKTYSSDGIDLESLEREVEE